MQTYQTPQFMADLLEKVQAMQLDIVRKNDGHSLDIDSTSNKNYFHGTGFHAGFDVALFFISDLIGTWNFSSAEDADVLNHTLDDLEFHIGRL